MPPRSLARASTLAAMLLAAPTVAGAQDTPNRVPPDHGNVLATCMDVAVGHLKDTTRRTDTKNYVFRGRVVSLGLDRKVSLCFDTELMRIAGAWAGRPVAYTADKNMGPAVDGTMLFTTRPGPGWASNGKWEDPRPGGERPLPHGWAHYRGLYLHGDRVVLSYTVGGCPVFELPGCIEAGDLIAVTRTFNLGPSAMPQDILICEEDAASKSKRIPLADGSNPRRSRNILVIERARDRLAIGLSGAPTDMSIAFDGRRCSLHLPARKTTLSFRLVIARMPLEGDLSKINIALEPPIEDITLRTKGGPLRWGTFLDTNGTVSPAGSAPYVVDDIGLPLANPWHMPVRPGGLDFFPDGRAALCTWDGDVWIVSGLDGSLGKVRWKRFATGLHQPLGLKIIDGVIYTAGRDQITRLHDLNGDGEADFYENFNNDAGLTLQRHEFVLDLQTDKHGNLYYGRSGHYVASHRGDNCCVYKLSPDGAKLEVFAHGFREPNGLSIGPDGTFIVSDNEGNGIPQTPLYRLEPGAFYGFTPSPSEALGVKGARWEYTRAPIVWLPINVDRSAGSQVWVPDGRFGPLKGQLLHTSYGHSALYTVLIDRQGEPWQGAVWKFPLPFSSGVMRARFNPRDGQLYLCGLRGWGTNAAKDGQFCRVRFTGGSKPIPVGFAVAKTALRIAFSAPLDPASVADEDNWTGDWSNTIVKSGMATRAKQELPIKTVRLSADRKSTIVELDRMMPSSNFRLQYQLKAVDGTPVVGELHGTIHHGN